MQFAEIVKNVNILLNNKLYKNIKIQSFRISFSMAC